VGSTVGLNALTEKKISPPLPEIAPQFLSLSLLPMLTPFLDQISGCFKQQTVENTWI